MWWGATRGDRGLFWGTAFLIMVATLLESLAPWALKYLFDTLESESVNAWVVALRFATLFFAARAGGVVLWNAGGWLANRFQPRVIARLEQNTFEHIIRQSPSFFADQFSGSLLKRIGRLTRSFERIHDDFSLTFIPIITMVVVGSVNLFSRSAWLGSAYIVWVLLVIGVNTILLRWTLPIDEKRNTIDSALGGAMADALSNASAIHTFATEKAETGRIRELSNRLARAQTRSWNRHQFARVAQDIFAMALDIGVLFIGLSLWHKGLVTVGDLIFTQFIVLQLFIRVRDIGRGLRGVSEAFADSAESVRLLEQMPSIQDRPKAKSLICKQGMITFNQVSFHYGTERAVLNGCDFSVASGEKVAFVGPSGAGKSTIMKLLLRSYEPNEGTVSIDDQNIQTVTQESVRKTIAFVPQEPALFHRSLFENIRYGNPKATLAEVKQAARRARCHDFISRLPLGYDTLVGERGVKLSGGERQRVAIARAMLKNAPILVLDEATAALDSESEQLIQEALHELMEKKTVLVIAHRLSTIMSMDRIIVMNQGKIVDQGTHEELIHRDGLYRYLWSIQAGGFLS